MGYPDLMILYRNHAGEVAVRRINPREVFHGTAPPWHTENCWLMRAWDNDHQAMRTFRLTDILAVWDPPEMG